MGLDDITISNWFNVCYPLQIRRTMQDFSGYSIQEIAEVGMKGARGLKKGVLADRRKASLSQWKAVKQDRDEAIRRKTAVQDIGLLVDEFL